MGSPRLPASLGTLSGVIVPTCENMWGVLIFLRFFFVVGHAGVGQALLIVAISFSSSFFTTMSLSGMATNGSVEAGGAYFIISRALGHKLGGAVGTTYFFGLSLLAVLEVLGAVEVMLYVDPSLYMGRRGGRRPGLGHPPHHRARGMVHGRDEARVASSACSSRRWSA